LGNSAADEFERCPIVELLHDLGGEIASVVASSSDGEVKAIHVYATGESARLIAHYLEQLAETEPEAHEDCST
jgi:hypothetical protein